MVKGKSFDKRQQLVRNTYKFNWKTCARSPGDENFLVCLPQFNERDILTNPGKVSKTVADHLALEQYEIFHHHRLAKEAEQERLADDVELKRYLEDK